MDHYIVLIGDIEASKKLDTPKREKIQQQLQKVLEEINENSSHLVSPYTLTLGDEFQAVLDGADNLFTYAWKILSVLYPVKVRFSIGVGELSTSINRKQALGMDGPAFHKAREGIDRLKKNGFLFTLSVQERKDTVLNALNNSLYLLSGQVRSWNRNRLAILYMLNQGMDYKAITKELSISEPAFYKNKEVASLDIVMDLCDDIATIINTWVHYELRDISYAAEPDSDITS